MMEQSTKINRNIHIATSSTTLKHSKWIVTRKRVIPTPTPTIITMVGLGFLGEANTTPTLEGCTSKGQY